MMTMPGKQEQITHDIAAKIRHGIYPAKSFLPSENELAELYGASRNTIRKSLGDLTDVGMIQKMKGKGSMVLGIDRMAFPVSEITSFSELNNAMGLEARTEVIDIEEASADEVPDEFYLDDPGSAFTRIRRLRIINGEPDVLDIDWLTSSIIPDVPRKTAETSLYAWIEGELGLTISYATKEIVVQRVSDDIAGRLKLDSDHKAVVVRSKVYLDDTRLIQLTESYHSPDRFRFVDFARRRRI